MSVPVHNQLADTPRCLQGHRGLGTIGHKAMSLCCASGRCILIIISFSNSIRNRSFFYLERGSIGGNINAILKCRFSIKCGFTLDFKVLTDCGITRSFYGLHRKIFYARDITFTIDFYLVFNGGLRTFLIARNASGASIHCADNAIQFSQIIVNTSVAPGRTDAGHEVIITFDAIPLSADAIGK